MTGVPGSENSSAFISSIRRRSLPSSGARRRRIPRLIRACGSLGVDAVHVVALLVGDHLERQLVVVAQERRPLAVLGDRRRLVQDVDQREPVLHPVRHEHPRHQREVERHVASVARRRSRRRRPPATGSLPPGASGPRTSRRCGGAGRRGTRGSPAGSRSSCPRARTGRARRPAAARPPPARARSRRRRTSPPAPAARRSSGPAGGSRSGASSTGRPSGSHAQFDDSKSPKITRASA